MKQEQRQSGGGMSCVLAKEIIISRLFKLGTFLLFGNKILQRTSPWVQGITKEFLRENLGWRRVLPWFTWESAPCSTWGDFGFNCWKLWKANEHPSVRGWDEPLCVSLPRLVLGRMKAMLCPCHLCRECGTSPAALQAHCSAPVAGSAFFKPWICLELPCVKPQSQPSLLFQG